MKREESRRERVLRLRREARIDVGLEPEPRDEWGRVIVPPFAGGQGRSAAEVEALGALAFIVIAALVAGGVVGLLLYGVGKAVGA